jgi:hypothetical protein
MDSEMRLVRIDLTLSHHRALVEARLLIQQCLNVVQRRNNEAFEE